MEFEVFLETESTTPGGNLFHASKRQTDIANFRRAKCEITFVNHSISNILSLEETEFTFKSPGKKESKTLVHQKKKKLI